jgi:hypothetical protein
MAKPSSITIPTEPIGQVDFTEGRLAVKVNRNLLSSFIDLNNLVLSRFSPEERSASGCMPARAMISIRRPARMSITQSCCPTCWSWKCATVSLEPGKNWRWC